MIHEKNNKSIFLLVKTHNKTGLKYLCKHEGNKKSCFEYCGSGMYWLRHLNKHGKDLATEILFETDTLEKFKERGLYYSNLWNVVKSEDWANLCPEAGEGCTVAGWKHSDEAKRKISLANKGLTRSVEARMKIRQTRLRLGLGKGKNNPNYGNHILAGRFVGVNHPAFGTHISQEHKEKLSAANKGKCVGTDNPNWKGGRSYSYRKSHGLLGTLGRPFLLSKK